VSKEEGKKRSDFKSKRIYNDIYFIKGVESLSIIETGLGRGLGLERWLI